MLFPRMSRHGVRLHGSTHRILLHGAPRRGHHQARQHGHPNMESGKMAAGPGSLVLLRPSRPGRTFPDTPIIGSMVPIGMDHASRLKPQHLKWVLPRPEAAPLERATTMGLWIPTRFP